MRIAVLSETDPVESRVVVQAGAGIRAGVSDGEFETAGATIARGPHEAARDADVVLTVRRPGPGEIGSLPRGAVAIAIMDPYGQTEALQALANAGVSAFAMELM